MDSSIRFNAGVPNLSSEFKSYDIMSQGCPERANRADGIPGDLGKAQCLYPEHNGTWSSNESFEDLEITK